MINYTDIYDIYDIVHSKISIKKVPKFEYLSIARLCISFILFSSISVLFFSNYVDTSYARFCDGSKFTDDGESEFDVIVGTDEPNISDCLIGTNKEDIIWGLDGDDYIKGKKADDVLHGGFGNDRIFGDSGDDNLLGGPGQDQLYGKRGHDVIFGGFDPDFLVGGKGNDELYGDFGSDILEGDSGADYFDCGDNYDVVVDFDPSEGDTHANNCEDIRRK